MADENRLTRDVIGLAVFFLGVALLILTFYTAYSVFTNPETLKGFAALGPEVEGGEIGKLIGPVVEMMSYVIAGLLLWVMGSVGGRIAKHGMKMYTAGDGD